ncbi:MAG: hypothetical protein DRJ61_16475 [Acidobacteria bacterium]|nr:MAG: hypothetical protein DRJ61_16475 [Acidobacteriota bacterium]
MMHDDLPATIERFYRQHRKELYSYALALTRNPEAAEDAVQTAIAGVLGRRRLPRNLRPYLMRAIRNATIDWRRACRKNKPELAVSAHGQASPVEERLLLEQCLLQLPFEVREVIFLKEVVGMTFREIGIICRRPLPTVASRHRRGIETMRTFLLEGPS